MSKKPADAACDPTSLGNLALMHGYVNQEELRRAIEWQRAHGLRIGEVLVKSGAMGEKTLEALVLKQEQVRKRPSSRDVARIVDFASTRVTQGSQKVEEALRGLHGAVSRILKR